MLKGAEWHALDWTKQPEMDQGAFAAALESTQRAMERQDKNFVHTYDWLQRNGDKPIPILQRYLELLEDAEQRNCRIVSHNGWRFDAKFLQIAFRDWLSVGWEWDPDALYDSGVAEKASQLPDTDNPLPQPHESMQDWALRVGGLRRRGIYWALDRYCEPKYGLLEKAAFDSSRLHESVYDAALLHYLYQEHRRQACQPTSYMGSTQALNVLDMS